MKTRMFALAAIAGLFLNVIGLAAGDTHTAQAEKRQSGRLISLLPESDGVAIFDSKRFLNDALPKVLAANQPMLSLIMAKIAEIETHTGIDLRKFDQIAVGVAYRQVTATETDYEPVVIASGEVGAGAVVAVARMASGGKYREEKVGDRTIYIFTPTELVQKTASKTANANSATAAKHAAKSFDKEIAITAIDKDTLAFGTPSRVRQTLEGTSHVGAELTGLLSSKETAVMAFALHVPAGLAKKLPLDNDELGANISSIQYLSGSVDVAATGTSLQIIARTDKPERALGLKKTLVGLQALGNLLGSSKNVSQQVYGRMVNNAKIEARANDVSLDLLVPQSDIDILVARLK